MHGTYLELHKMHWNKRLHSPVHLYGMILSEAQGHIYLTLCVNYIMFNEMQENVNVSVYS
jgi:hypothetical protein